MTSRDVTFYEEIFPYKDSNSIQLPTYLEISGVFNDVERPTKPDFEVDIQKDGSDQGRVLTQSDDLNEGKLEGDQDHIQVLQREDHPQDTEGF
ncbi:hypothetical protein SESBI_43630 [Sesbania bispinosa]|nr:hypothetical protein SESBI_43630 [Sesbania bispinosa]